MPKLQTNAQRRYRYDMIARAEGEQCLMCHIEKFVRRSRLTGKLEIDHADSDQTNWSWSNLHLVCHKHNCILRNLSPRQHLTLMRGYSDQLERERERENLPTWKTVLKDQVPYETGSPEMQANRNFEKRWLRYAHQSLLDNGSVKKKELISGGSAFSNCSIQTSTNYLTKYTSPISVFQETMDSDGDKIIVYRELKLRLPSPSPRAVRSRLVGQVDASGNDGGEHDVAEASEDTVPLQGSDSSTGGRVATKQVLKHSGGSLENGGESPQFPSGAGKKGGQEVVP